MFYLNFSPDRNQIQLNIKDKVLLIGSCFSNNIGKIMIANKFNCIINPAGTLYNPISIFRLLQNSISKDPEISLIQNQGIYYDWNHHSDLSNLDQKKLVAEIKKTYKSLQQYIKNLKWIIITPGTSWVYTLKTTDKVVANCHKMPSSNFNKALLTSEEIINEFNVLKIEIEKINPEVNWLFTISPVRHIRDGLVENNQSKAILIESTRRLLIQYKNVHYFPSYEIVIDQLRDYRFYNQDMIHPSAEATTYIWEKLKESFFDKETLNILKRWKKVADILNHRPRFAKSIQHQQLLKKTLNELNELKEIIDVNKEIEEIKTALL